MKFKISALCFMLFAFCFVPTAHANWEKRPVYIDDGARFTLSVRGGFAYGMGKIRNELGTLTPEPYWYDGLELVTESFCGGPAACTAAGYTAIGQVDLAELPANKNLSTFTWAGAVGVGFTVPDSPNWRIEANWDHISIAKYSAAPLFKGNLVSSEGYKLEDVMAGGVYSKLTNDIITAMFYYDFFDGCVKPAHEFIPYVGLGFGYASSRTELELTDLFGNLSDQASMQEFGVPGAAGLDFYKSRTITGNVVGAAAVGFSYGIMDGMFLDMGLRFTYIPRINWTLNNAEVAVSDSAVKHKEIFSARNVIYTNALIGLRFEF